ncbi:enoyl-CoA hydratase/isomerase family protein [Hutsoniella sourekii]
MSEEVVLKEIKDGIATLTINRPKALNALNHDVINQLEVAFDEVVEDDQVQAVVLRGSGDRAFVAGADLKFFVENVKAGTPEKIVEFTAQGHDLFRRMETSPKLTIAVVDGLSLGGGSEIALAQQAIIATEKGSFGFPESGLGIYPGYGGLLRTNKHIGPALTKYYGLTGQTISAEEAYELGIVQKLVKAEEIDQAIKDLVEAGAPDKYAERSLPEKYQAIQEAFDSDHIQDTLKGQATDGLDEDFVAKVAKKIGYKSPHSVEMIQKIVDQQTDQSIDEGIRTELDYLEPMFRHPEADLGLTAVVNGERPDFSKV